LVRAVNKPKGDIRTVLFVFNERGKQARDVKEEMTKENGSSEGKDLRHFSDCS